MRWSQRVTHTLEQVLAEAETLMRRRQINLVNLALIPALQSRAPERGISCNSARHLEHEQPVAASHGVFPPSLVAAADHAFQVQMRNDAPVGQLPRIPEHVGQGPRIFRRAPPDGDLRMRLQHVDHYKRITPRIGMRNQRATLARR